MVSRTISSKADNSGDLLSILPPHGHFHHPQKLREIGSSTWKLKMENLAIYKTTLRLNRSMCFSCTAWNLLQYYQWTLDHSTSTLLWAEYNCEHFKMADLASMLILHNDNPKSLNTQNKLTLLSRYLNKLQLTEVLSKTTISRKKS